MNSYDELNRFIHSSVIVNQQICKCLKCKEIDNR